ncbi:protein detoxification 19 [Quercus suber]|uniref:Protein detoxification 19 n=1 Tax=Quercus suber TaxID=58331 RepID=A0AAW0KDM5_QUESU
MHWTSLSFVRAPVAASVSLWLSVLMLSIYLTCSKKFERSWQGFSLESFQYIPTDLKIKAFAYMFSYGLSAAVSLPDQAKNAMGVSLKLSLLVAFILVLAIGFGHKTWIGFFRDSSNIIMQFTSMIPLLLISIFIDSVLGVISGVARGCGW